MHCERGTSAFAPTPKKRHKVNSEKKVSVDVFDANSSSDMSARECESCYCKYNPEAVRLKLMESQKPLIMKGALNRNFWSGVPRDWDTFISECGSVLLNFRLVPVSSKEPAWEGNADFIEASVEEFIHWLASDTSASLLSPKNPFHGYSRHDYWAYSAYNHMNERFSKCSNLLKNVDWSSFGFDGRCGEESTIWIGSRDANTPCHLDTYGCNLVAQVIGRKQWILFPPEDSKCMYPTRIPYEESSVFSSVNIMNPDLIAHKHFKDSHPHAIILEPGDVLFVPPNWWHFVLCIDDSVSINTWISLDSDVDSRVKEGITKVLMGLLVQAFEPPDESWLNPSEDIESPTEVFNLLKIALDLSNNSCPKSRTVVHSFPQPSDGESSTHCENKTELIAHSECKCTEAECLCNAFSLVTSLKFPDYLKSYCQHNDQLSDTSSTKTHPDIKDILNCFVHPDVVSGIFAKLKAL